MIGIGFRKIAVKSPKAIGALERNPIAVGDRIEGHSFGIPVALPDIAAIVENQPGGQCPDIGPVHCAIFVQREAKQPARVANRHEPVIVSYHRRDAAEVRILAGKGPAAKIAQPAHIAEVRLVGPKRHRFGANCKRAI